MRRQLGFCVLLATGAAVVLGAASAGVKVAPDPENVVASRLAGTWATDADLWTRLAGGPVHIPLRSYRFEADESVAAGLPAQYADFLKDKPIYLAGRISGGHLREACPFILTVLHGNPYVVYFRERNGDPMGDAESFNVMLARGAKPENDILFIGGDFNNQPFTAYRRVADIDLKELQASLNSRTSLEWKLEHGRLRTSNLAEVGDEYFYYVCVNPELSEAARIALEQVELNNLWLDVVAVSDRVLLLGYHGHCPKETTDRIIDALDLRTVNPPEVWYKYVKKHYKCKWQGTSPGRGFLRYGTVR